MSKIFQFHKGTIRTILPRILHLCLTYFNSIKVQLELTIDDALLAIPEFQFHKGTIRTTAKRLKIDNTPKFQFHKGTIRTLERPVSSLSMFISIP